MSDDDVDLTRRLLTIDEGPRPDWVTDLRATLASSFEVEQGARRRPSSSARPAFSAVSLSLGFAASIVLVMVATFWVPSSTSRVKPVSPSPSSTIATPSVRTPVRNSAHTEAVPTVIAGTSCPYDVAGAGDSRVVTAGSSVWVLSRCFDGHHWEGLEIVEIDATSGDVLSTRRVPLADFQAPYTGYGASEGANLDGVVERRAVVRLHDHLGLEAIFTVDADTGVVRPIPFAEPTVLSGGGGFVGHFVGLIGNVLIAFGAHDVGGRLSCTSPIALPTPCGGVFDPTNGLVPTIDTLDLVSGATTTQQVASETGPRETLTSSSDALWFSAADTSHIVRVDADGSMHHLDRFNGSIYPSGVIGAPGNLWVAIEDPTAKLEPRLVRVDRDDGHALSPAVPLPAGSEIAEMFTTLHASSRGLLITDPSSGWWWIDNAGNSSQLAVPNGAFVAVIDDRVLVVDPAGKVVVHSIVELAS